MEEISSPESEPAAKSVEAPTAKSVEAPTPERLLGSHIQENHVDNPPKPADAIDLSIGGVDEDDEDDEDDTDGSASEDKEDDTVEYKQLKAKIRDLRKRRQDFYQESERTLKKMKQEVEARAQVQRMKEAVLKLEDPSWRAVGEQIKDVITVPSQHQSNKNDTCLSQRTEVWKDILHELFGVQRLINRSINNPKIPFKLLPCKNRRHSMGHN